MDLDLRSLNRIAFQKIPYAGRLLNPVDREPFFDYVRVPLAYLSNRGLKALDVSLIHELIHKVETEGHEVGLRTSSVDDNYTMINEIHTQKLAILITKQLHDQGIFIYDNPNDYRIEGESHYEQLFPLADHFLDEFEDVILDHAINHDLEPLDHVFGDSWKSYSEHINKTWSDMNTASGEREISLIQMDSEVSDMISDMRQKYYSSKGEAKNV